MNVAWSRECPTANAQWDKARAAYLNRPTYFANPPASESNTDARRRRPSQEGWKTSGKPQPRAERTASDHEEAHQSHERACTRG
ncbi:hypothetical protein E4U39_002469 [Claviceps sp. Clav50 group G5]|nr:hypothetical protein E4U39_002469 [Claviceps sp. Clav50 group G5]